MVPAGERLPWFATYPVPDLLAGLLVRIDNKVLADGFGHPLVDLEASGSVGDCGAQERDESPFLSNCCKSVHVSFDGDIQRRVMVVPSQVFPKKGLEVEGLEALPDGGNVEFHVFTLLLCFLVFRRRFPVCGVRASK
ncbi:MAG: hypothetical protein KatS3mg082_3363 [Nitrospiraceae bacterium]|nr:MAG: hypothetical protein KatS3mg082_3363 [Nitrospiraceae bacterium]